MKKIFLFLCIVATIFCFGNFAKASEPENYGIDPFKILITFQKSVADLSQEAGRKKASEIISNHKEWVKIAFINEQNLAIVGIGKQPAPNDILDDDTLVAQFQKALVALNEINSGNQGRAQFNFLYTLQGKVEDLRFVPSDQLYPLQTSLFAKYTLNGNSIGFRADEAWNLTERKVYEGRGVYKERYTNEVVVAIIDNGLAETSYNDKDIKDVIWGKEKSDSPCLDYNGQQISCPNGSIDMVKYLRGDSTYGSKIQKGYHGEAMAKIIASQIENNSYGLAGINNVVSSKEKYVRVIPINTQSDIRTGEYSGTSQITSAEVIAGIHFAKRNRADIINLSMIKSSINGQDNFLVDAIKLAGQSGIFTVAIDKYICSHEPETVSYIGGSFAPIICTTGYSLPKDWPANDKNYKIIKDKGVFDMTFSLKDGQTVDIWKRLVWNSGSGGLGAPEWATIQESSRNSTYTMTGASISNAHVTGALAHIFRFGIAAPKNKELARCILENSTDEYLFWDGVIRTVNLAKIAKFSGNLEICKAIESEKLKIPAPHLEIRSIKLIKAYKDSLLNDVYDLGFNISIPDGYAYNLEYLLYIQPYMGYLYGVNSISNVKKDGDDNIFQITVTYAPKSDKNGNRPKAFIDQDFCASILARGLGSLNSEWSKQLCVSGGDLLKQSENLTMSAEIDQAHLAEIFNKKNEDFDIIEIGLNGMGSMSNGKYDVEVNIARKFECDFSEKMFKPAELKLVKNSFLPPIIKKFSSIRLENGSWTGEVSVPRSTLTPLVVSVVARSEDGKAQAFERILYPTDGYFCVSGAQYDRQLEILEIYMSALLARDHIIDQPRKGVITLWARGGKLDSYYGYGANINHFDTRSENQIWTAYKFEILDINPSNQAGFQFIFKVPLQEIKNLGGSVFFDVNGHTNLLYYNEGGKALALPAYLGIPVISDDGDGSGRDNFSSAGKESDRIAQIMSKLKPPTANNVLNNKPPSAIKPLSTAKSPYTLTMNKIGLPKENHALQATITPALTDLKAKGFFEFYLQKSSGKTIRFYTNSVKPNAFSIISSQIRFPDATYCIRPGLILSNKQEVLGLGKCSDGTTEKASSPAPSNTVDR